MAVPGVACSPLSWRRLESIGAAFDPGVKSTRITGQVPLERLGRAEEDQGGAGHDQRSGDLPDPGGAAAQGPGPGGRPAAQVGDEQQGYGGAGGVAQCHGHGLGPHPVGGPDHGDGSQHRTGAGHEDQPEAGPEQQAVAGTAHPFGGQAGERPLDQVAQGGYDQAEAKHEKHGYAEVPQEVLGQPEEAEQRAPGQGDGGKSQDHPGHDAACGEDGHDG